MSVQLRAMIALVLFTLASHWTFGAHAQDPDPFAPDPFAEESDLFGDGSDPFGGEDLVLPKPGDDSSASAGTKARAVVNVPRRRASGSQADAEERIQKELAKPTTIDFIEIPLREVVDYLSDLHVIDVLIDTRALAEVGIGDDTPITRHLRDVSLRSALRLMLTALDLTFIVRDGALVITTPEETESEYNLITKVYGVKHLLRSDDPLVDEDPWAGDDIIDLIVSILRPTTWEDVGGPGSIELLRNSLVVSNTMGVHDEIADLLMTLDKVQKVVASSKFKPPKSISFPRPSRWEQRIAKALAQKVDCDFKGTSLQDVIDYLAHETEIDIQIDHRALENVGIGSDTPITFRVQGISMASVLRLMLKEMDLVYIVRDEILLISTPEEAEQELQTRIFPVADLVLPWNAPTDSLTSEPWQAAADYDSLIDLLTATLRPTMWDDVGGPGAIESWHGCLVISQTGEVLEEVEQLLAGLRAFQAKLRENPRRIIEESIRLDESGTPAMAELREALTLDVGMLSFRETPLSEVMQTIAEKQGVPILIDRRTLDDVGIDSNALITVTLGGDSLGQALRRILREMDCVYVLRDEAILITAMEGVELIPQIYHVGDLVLPAPDELTGESNDADFDSLRDTILRTVRPIAWQEIGGPGAMEPYYPVLGLVVSQTEEVHEEIGDLLAQIRKVEAAAKQAAEQSDEKAIPTDDEALKNKQGQRLHLKIYRLTEQDREHSEELVEIIRELIAPKSWDADEKHYLRPLAGSIIVRHTAPTHRTIHRLLAELDVFAWPQFGGGGSGLGGMPAGSGGIFSVPAHIQGQVGTGTFASGSMGGISPPASQPFPVHAIRSLSLPATDDRPAMVMWIYRTNGGERDELCQTIRELVEPELWDAEGVYIRAFEDRLIIRQETRVQKKIYRLLIELGVITRPKRFGHAPGLLHSVIPVVGGLDSGDCLR